MIEKAVREQIEHTAFRFPDSRSVLANCISIIADGVADRITNRITNNVERERRMAQLFKTKKTK